MGELYRRADHEIDLTPPCVVLCGAPSAHKNFHRRNSGLRSAGAYHGVKRPRFKHEKSGILARTRRRRDAVYT